MPRKVDRHERRTRIAAALMRVAAERGLEAVSLRHVAAEASVSVGMVQHYFRDKDEMMVFALGRVSENVAARLAAGGDADTPLREMLRALLVQLLPLDEERTVEGQVALAFQAYAAVRPTVAEGLRENTAQMRAFVGDRIRAAQAAGEAVTTVDPLRAATALLALVEGLGVHVLGGHYSADEALAVFDAHLDTLFGP
ncbi:MAG: TetR/AcrR family transcriptional regulator [Pseudonocardia sp.]|nr:TetR/AcrR family transcriptional regulator [Pseudonocardia sp.]